MYNRNTFTPAKAGFLQHGHVTPDNKIHDGIDSSGRLLPAPYLPLLRYDEEQFTHIVISNGKPVAFLGKYLVPAGLKFELEAVKSGEAATYVYSIIDVQQGIRNFAGDLVKAGEAVATSILAATPEVTVSGFVGIANYNYFRNGGGDGHNPAHYNYTNFNPQAQVSFNMQYVYELPIVATQEAYDTAPLTGIAAFLGRADTLLPGQFVTYDKYSNYVVTATDFTVGGLDQSVVVGQLYRVDLVSDPDDFNKVINPVNSLDQVVAPENLYGTRIEEIPGSRTGGLTQKLMFANAHGYARFKLNTR